MVRQRGVRAFLGVAALMVAAATCPGADLSQSLQDIKSVGAEGRGSSRAASAWKQLARERGSSIPQILAALDDANPLAANYLRSAVETIAERERQHGGSLPANELEAFLRDRAHSPRGRRMAFELLSRIDPTAPDRLIPGMLDDPSVELRRDAVERLIVEGNGQFDAERRADARTTFRRALSGARDDDQVQAIRKRLEELGEKVDLSRHFGFLMNWRLIAPFDNVGKKGFDVAYPPERELAFDAEYEGKDGAKVRWIDHTTDNEYGIVDLAKALAPFKGAVAYAATEFISDGERAVDFRLGTPNSWKVWLNGELLFAREEYHRGMSLDQYRMRGTLKPGKNVILVKVLQNEQTEDWAQRWQFQLRICDSTGTAILSTNRRSTQSPAGD